MSDRKPYLGKRGKQKGRTPYLAGHAANTERTPYLGEKQDEPKHEKKHHGHGGILGVLGRGATDLKDAAVNIPAGVYYVGGKLAEDTQRAGRHPLRESSIYQALTGGKQPRESALVKDVARPTVEATKQDLRHPLRHPGYTALDILGIASAGAGTVARGSAAAGKLGEGARAGEVATAALRGPKPGVRRFKVGELEVTQPASRSALTRGAQKIGDARLEKAAAKKPAGRAARKLNRKAGKFLGETLRTEEAIAKAPASALAAVGKKLKPHEQYALRLAAEEAPTEGRVVAHRARMADAKVGALERRRHAKRIRLIEKAMPLLDEASGKPVLRDARLKGVYAKMQDVAGSREQLAKDLGLLTDEMIEGRKTAAGRAALGDELRTPAQAETRLKKLESEHNKALDKIAGGMFGSIDRAEVARRNATNARADRQAAGVTRAGKPSGASTWKAKRKVTVTEERRRQAEATVEQAIARNPDHPTMQAWSRRTAEIDRLRAALNPEPGDPIRLGHEDFKASPEATYIPDVEQKLGRSGNVASVGGQGSIGQPTNPVRYGYSGGAKRTAREPLKTTRAVAESQLAVAKLHRLVNLREKLAKAASPEPRFKGDIAIRLDKLAPKTLEEKKLPRQRGKGSAGLPADVRAFIDNPDDFGRLHVDDQSRVFEKLRKDMLAPEEADAFQKLYDAGKIGWVPKRLLGDLAKQQAPLSATVGKVPVQAVDSINNAQKLAVLYLKPAYAVPNLLGNAALSLVQQGFAAPKNVARAATMQWRLGADLTARVDSVMHEGFAAALRGEQGALSKATSAAANVWGKGVDKPFRRASFLHEAARDGYRTAKELERLLTDPAAHEDLVNVAKRANREIIDYGRLSSREREIVRRVIFFYPWVKGSTLYAGNFLLEHPVKAAAGGQVGRQGQAFAERSRGPAPSFLGGSFAAGGGLVNPASAAILQTPAQAASTLAGITGLGPVSQDAEPYDFVTPGAALAMNLLAGKNLRTGHEYDRRGRDVGHVGRDTLVDSLPQMSLYNALRGNEHSKLYEPSKRAAVGKFLVGGLYPRPYNKAYLRSLAAREQRELNR